jgi:hemolysin activation/secretion protein
VDTFTKEGSRTTRSGKALLLLLASLSIIGLESLSTASAQDARSELPASVLPDVRLEQLPQKVPSQAPVEVTTPKALPSRIPVGAEKVRFVLNGLDIAGATVYSQSELGQVYSEFLGKEVTLAKVYEFVETIQRLYRRDGYFLTRVILPPQTARDGRLRVAVIEGYVSDVQIQGDIGPVEEKVKIYLSNVLSERPLKLKTLERYLLLARDIPGVDVEGVLKPAPDTPGTAQLVASVERKGMEGFALVDNIGTTFTGNWEIAASASSNSFTRYGEQFSITGLVTDPQKGFGSDKKNQKVIQLSASFLPGSDGEYVRLLGSYGDSNPGDIISHFDFDSTSLLLSAVGGYPIIRSRPLNLYAELGFDYINSDTDIFGDIKYARDRLRVLHLTGNIDFRDKWHGANAASLGIRQGLPILGASESDDDYLSRADGSGTFTTLQASASRLQAITGPYALFLSIAGQYSFSDLLSDEEFGVGGIRFGRGYDPKELSDDGGVGFTGELQFTKPTDLWALESYQLFAFYDYGKVWDHSSSDSNALSSFGGGVRLWAAQDTSIALQLAKPLTRDSQRADGDRDTQLLFRALTHF